MKLPGRQRIRRWIGTAGAVGILIAGFTAPAEDVIVTQNQTFRGKVQSADANGIAIEVSIRGVQSVITVPRAQVVQVAVEPPPSVIRGIEAYEKGDIKEAQLSLGKMMLQYQGLDVAWAAKGMIYFARASLKAGDYEKAEKAFTLFTATYPDHAMFQDAQIGLVEIDLVKKNYEAALAKYRELAEPYTKQLKPADSELSYAAEIYMGIGKCLEGQSNPAEALQAYLRVVALYPAEAYYPEALYRSARLYAGLNQPEKAEALLTELIGEYATSSFAPLAIQEKKTLAARRGTGSGSPGSKPAKP